MTNELAKKFLPYLFLFAGIIVLFAGLAALYPEADSAGDSLSASSLCSTNGCYYNVSRTTACTANNVTYLDTTPCTNSSGEDGFPLNSLLVGGGVIFLILAAVVIGYIIKHHAKQ